MNAGSRNMAAIAIAGDVPCSNAVNAFVANTPLSPLSVYSGSSVEWCALLLLLVALAPVWHAMSTVPSVCTCVR